MKKRKNTPQDVVLQMLEREPSPTDPMGSWTGQPVDEYEIPVQDADDL